ncbi:MAG: ribonuclease III domain-containing protein [Candidatus Thorarchaeota archaeon]
MRWRRKTTLDWTPVLLRERLDALQRTITRTREQTARNSTRMLGKLQRWQVAIKSIQSRLEAIDRNLRPALEDRLEVKIPDSEKLQVAMFQPSTRNLFLELATQYQGKRDDPIGTEGFDALVSLSDRAKALALLGDAAVSMAVVLRLWSPRTADVGDLTKRRSEVVSNSHMASVCDDWSLYEHRIHFDPGEPSREEMEHDKGTLVESVYGIILIEHGFNQVMDSITYLF